MCVPDAEKENADCRGQHMSIYDLQEEDAEDQENQVGRLKKK